MERLYGADQHGAEKARERRQAWLRLEGEIVRIEGRKVGRSKRASSSTWRRPLRGGGRRRFEEWPRGRRKFSSQRSIFAI